MYKYNKYKVMEKFNKLEQKDKYSQNLNLKIDNFLNLLANIDIHENQDDILEEFSELYESNKEQCIEAILQNINLKNPDNYFKTGLTLEFIKNLYIISLDSMYGFENLFRRIKEVIKKTTEEKDGSYLLNLREKNVYKTITHEETADALVGIEHSEEHFAKEMKIKYGENWQEEWKKNPENFEYIPTESEYDEVPFEITEETYAFFDKNNLFIARPEDFSAITSLINRYKRTKRESMVSVAALSDEDLVRIGEDPAGRENFHAFYYVENPEHPHALTEMQEMLEEIKKYCSILLLPSHLLVKHINKTPEEIEKEKQNLFDYTYLMNRPIREAVEEEFGLKFKYLSFQEQFYFLQLIKNKTVDEMQEVKNFTANYGHNGLKTFMSMEFDRDLGDRIIKLGEKLDPSMAREIFHKYSDIIDSAQDAFKYFQDNFMQAGAFDEKIADHIKENLFKKGADILVQFAEKVVRGEKISNEEIIKELKNIKTETLIFTSSFKIFKEESKFIDLADIPDMRYDVNSVEKFTNDKALIGQMEKIYRKNYENYPSEFTEYILKSFKESLKDTSSILFTLKHKEDLVAFCRLGKNLDGNGNIESFHFGSFNVSPSYKQSRLGEALFEAAMMEAGALGVPIYANCDPQAPITKKYIKSGFVATKIFNFKGVPSFKIEYNNELRDNLRSIKISKEEVIKLTKDKENKKNELVVQDWAVGESSGFEMLNRGYILTQYFMKNNRVYAVFEKDPRVVGADKSQAQAA